MATKKNITPEAFTLSLPKPPDGVTRGWKFLNSTDTPGYVASSNYDGSLWALGVWRTVGNSWPIGNCDNGFHMSPTPAYAHSFVYGTVLALVECRGDADTDSDKSSHREMRVIATWDGSLYQKDGIVKAHYTFRNDRTPAPDTWTITNAYHIALEEADAAYYDAVRPADNAYAKAVQPLSDECDRKISEAEELYRQAITAARTIRDTAVQSATDQYGRDLLPVAAIRDMLNTPHVQAKDAAYAAAESARTNALAEARAAADAANAEVQATHDAAILPLLGKPQHLAAEYGTQS